MITAANYFDYAPKYVGKFNQAMKEGHELLLELKEIAGSLDDPSVVEGDIAEVVKLQINQLNKLAAQQSNAPVEKRESKPTRNQKPKIVKTKVANPNKTKGSSVSKRNPKIKRSTKENGNGENFPIYFKDPDRSSWTKVNSAKSLIEIANKIGHYEILDNDEEPISTYKGAKAYLISQGYKFSNKPLKAKTTKSKTTKKPKKFVATNNKSKPKKAVKKKPENHTKAAKKLAKGILKEEKARIPVKVNKLSLELQIIKSFISLDGKTLTKKGVTAKLKALKGHFDKGHISDHKSIIETIIQKVGKAVEHVHSANSEKVEISLEKAFKAKCQAIVKSAKPKLQVNYLGGLPKKKKAARK